MNQNGEWSEINVTNRDLFAVWAAGATIVATGADGMIILSEDNGVSFNILDGKTHSDLWGVWGRSATDFWVTGRSKTSCTLLHRRYSRGKVSFRKEVTRKKMQGSGLVGCGETVLLAGNHVHDAGILRTANNGGLWSEVAKGYCSGIAAHGQTVIVSMADSTVMESTNGGDDWVTRRIIKDCCHLQNVWFDDAGRAFTAGTGSCCAVFCRELDGSWRRLDLPSKLYMRGTYGAGRHWLIVESHSRHSQTQLCSSSNGDSFDVVCEWPGHLMATAVTDLGTIIAVGLKGMLWRFMPSKGSVVD